MERQLLTATMTGKRLLSERTQTFHFTLAVVGTDAFEFTPGQFVSLVAPDARGKQQTRAYSLASAPRGAEFDLCINRVEGGFFSNLLADMEIGGTVQFHGPHGLFTLREPLTDILLISTGTGIAPMRGFLEHLFPSNGPSRLPHDKQLWVIYGTRHETELYYEPEIAAIAARHSNVHYVPTLSRPRPEWGGARGYVQERVAEVLRRHVAGPDETPQGGALGADPDPKHPESDTADNPRRPEANQPPEAFTIHAYICGLNAMVSSVRDLLKERGWHRRQIVFERYD